MIDKHDCDSFNCSCYLRARETTFLGLIRTINRELDIIENNDNITGFFHSEEMEKLRQRLVLMYKRNK
jgi:hypothetical protein